MRVVLAMWLAACGAGSAHSDVGRDAPLDAANVPHLVMTLGRDGSQIGVEIRALDADGTPLRGQGAVELTTLDGIQSVPETAQYYSITLTPSIASGEYPISAVLPGFTGVSATPLVLPAIDDTWNLAERVPGTVNTPGYESSVEVSPDGEWLVLQYSPIDVTCCEDGGAACGDVSGEDALSARCETVLGPYAAPARPSLPGADRITSPMTIIAQCSSRGYPQPQSFPFPPLGDYGFHRQPDGSFAEPFSINFTADDGCLAPTGLSFLAAPNGTSAELVFGWDDPRDDRTEGDTSSDVYAMPMTLGAPVSLGEITYSDNAFQTISFAPQRLALEDLANTQNNPHFAAPWLWFDDGVRTYVAEGGPLPVFPFAEQHQVAVTGNNEIAPFVDGARLYFAAPTKIISAELTGNDPTDIASWGPQRTELTVTGSLVVGEIHALGEPSVAHDASGATWLYFSYVVKTATGYDSNVGRIRAR